MQQPTPSDLRMYQTYCVIHPPLSDRLHSLLMTGFPNRLNPSARSIPRSSISKHFKSSVIRGSLLASAVNVYFNGDVIIVEWDFKLHFAKCRPKSPSAFLRCFIYAILLALFCVSP